MFRILNHDVTPTEILIAIIAALLADRVLKIFDRSVNYLSVILSNTSKKYRIRRIKELRGRITALKEISSDVSMLRTEQLYIVCRCIMHSIIVITCLIVIVTLVITSGIQYLIEKLDIKVAPVANFLSFTSNITADQNSEASFIGVLVFGFIAYTFTRKITNSSKMIITLYSPDREIRIINSKIKSLLDKDSRS